MKSLDTYLEEVGPRRLFAYSARASERFDGPAYAPGDALLFGPETRGLPATVMERVPAAHRLRVPMRAGQRSLNLSNAVAVAAYEAWRQLSYAGAGADADPVA